MSKLTTTAEVLQHMREVGGRNWRHATAETYAADTATALYIAECVRLRQAWDHLEGPVGCDYEYAPCIFNTLRAALE